MPGLLKLSRLAFPSFPSANIFATLNINKLDKEYESEHLPMINREKKFFFLKTILWYMCKYNFIVASKTKPIVRTNFLVLLQFLRPPEI